MARALSITALFLVTFGMPATGIKNNPLSQVIQLMDSLTAKITAEGEAEAKAFKEYTEFCDNAAANTRYEIQTGESKKSELDAAISKANADIAASSAKIDDLSGAIATDQQELHDATTVRTKEEATFVSSEKELMDGIDTLDRAINILQREMSKNPAALAQIDTRNINTMLSSLNAVMEAASFTSQDQRKLVALVQAHQESAEDADDLQPGAPAGTVYATHSTSIFDVLEDMKEKAEGQLADLRKAEANAKHNFAMLKQSLEDQMEADSKNMDEEKTLKAAAEEGKATAQGDLAETVKELNADKSALKTATTTCMSVAADHDATVKSRTEELAAIAEAKKVLLQTTSGAEQQSYSLFQVNKKTSLHLQSRADLANAEVVGIIKKLAKTQHSAALAQLASRITAVLRYGQASGDDPFIKVKGLITDMIAKLEAEAGQDATEKAYCDDELSKTNEKKSDLESVISKLSSKIDVASAKSASLKSDVKALQAELATLAKQQANMDSIRAEEKSNYDKAKSELEQGIAGVQRALSVLKDYYGGASFVQNTAQFDSLMQQPSKPETFVKATGAGQSIIDIIEVVLSDFTKNLAAEETQEEDAVSVYEKTTQQNSVTKTIKDQDVKYKTQEYKGLDKSIADLSGDKDTTSTELAAVNEYLGKLQERCIAKPETYASRKARREAEIAGLKEALSILENETAFTQRRKRGHLRNSFLQ
jgi:chromosome segregation ATPase